MEAIANAPTPTNIQEVHSFLVLLNYYGKFVHNLSAMVQPLNALLQAGKNWNWTSECAQAFHLAKRTLSSSERNYSDRKGSSISGFFFAKKKHQYLYGRKFNLTTDHKPLTAIFGPKKGIPSLAAAHSKDGQSCFQPIPMTYDIIQHNSTVMLIDYLDYHFPS